MTKCKGISIEEYEEYNYEGGMGFCLHCDDLDGGVGGYVEPDACGYECSQCGNAQVYGLGEILIMGLVN